MKEHDPKERKLNPKAHLPHLKEAFPTQPNHFDLNCLLGFFQLIVLFGFWGEGFDVCCLGFPEDEHPTLHNKINERDPW